jgi:hypothetical protein
VSVANEVLLDQAKRWILSNQEVRGCWHLVVQGIELGWLDREELHELLKYLRNHEEYGVEELLFSYVGAEVQVSFLDDHAMCSPEALIEELSSFLATVPRR